MHRDADVIVAGAGIAGLGLACALTRAGLDVLLLEKRGAPGGIHRGDSLLPKSVAHLRVWGALPAIRRAGARPIDRLEIHHHRLGIVRETTLRVDPQEDEYLVLPHPQIEEALTEVVLARGARLLRRASVVGLVWEDERVVGVRFRRGGSYREVRAPLVVAADGGRSAVRRALGIEAQFHGYDHGLFGLEVDRPPGYRDAMRLQLHAEGGLILMPHTDRLGVGVLVEADSAARWMGMDDARLSRALAARAPILEGLRVYRQGSHVYRLFKMHAESYSVPGAVLIGDAAHCANPAAGQGMGMALTDAAALAAEVAPVLRAGQGSLEDALQRYEARQRPVNARLIKRSDQLAWIYSRRGAGWDFFKARLLQFLNNPVGDLIAKPMFRAFLRDRSHSTRPDNVVYGGGCAPPAVPPPTRRPACVANVGVPLRLERASPRGERWLEATPGRSAPDHAGRTNPHAAQA